MENVATLRSLLMQQAGAGTRRAGVPEAAIEAMTRSLVNQLMHRPTERLRGMDPILSRELIALFD